MIVLCRHAATEVNLAMRFLSTTDAPLGERGLEQCEALREALRSFNFERCLVSPMRRAMQTRAIVAPEVPFEIEPGLREVSFGSWEGRSPDEVEAVMPGAIAARRAAPALYRPPGGESIEDAAARLQPIAERLERMQNTLVIGHRIALGILERLLRADPLDSQLVIGLQPAEFRIVRD
ncbi:MAG TPA: histidine phosphatase family protein [Candidatus Nitrosotalea sp.]|nr:histidine phosphatase family protein [Candidatus Nitrosotalea sp.]